MSEDMPTPSGDAYISHLKSALSSGAVIKAKLITLRSENPDSFIIALEGGDDKIVYGQWIKSIRPDFVYEPFPCGGKKQIRQLNRVLGEDLNGLSERVCLMVDRDFDDLKGFGSTASVFMTDFYSVENYLVCEEVLEKLLRDEFPCHGVPQVRKKIVALFLNDYSKFLEITREVNRRIFIARRTQLELKERIPTSLRKLAIVELGRIDEAAVQAEDIIVYVREPTPEELVGLDECFASLDPSTRYRGKFALKFFREWLNRLANEFERKELDILNGVEGNIRREELVLSNFASKSPLPQGLQSFIHSVMEQRV